MKIELTHLLDENVSLNKLSETLNYYKSNWDNKDFYGDKISLEGGSGIKKIKRILQYELQALKSSFDFSFNNSRLTISINFDIHIIDENTNN